MDVPSNLLKLLMDAALPDVAYHAAPALSFGVVQNALIVQETLELPATAGHVLADRGLRHREDAGNFPGSQARDFVEEEEEAIPI